ncbi:hypothetical protein EC988_002133 [Linderina pennispora]|nr:hypothetical protein EC988_002133 [Linderina pennispora]
MDGQSAKRLRLDGSAEQEASSLTLAGIVEQAKDECVPMSPASTNSRAKNYVCDECGKAFTRPCKLEEHSHMHTGARPYACPFPGCTKTYMRDTHLAVHTRTHSPALRHKYQCSVCPKGFATNQHLKRHMRTHETPKPFACTSCPMAFSKKSQLHAHTSKHTGEPPYKCSECGHGYMHPSQLKRHRMKHSTQDTYRCAVGACTQTFATWSALQTHMKSHKPEPIACAECHEEFKKRHQLTAHMRKCHGDTSVLVCPYDECGRLYSDAKGLNAHVSAVHLGRARFACTHPGCNKSYVYKHSLHNHVAKAHGDGPKDEPKKAPRTPASLVDVLTGAAYSNPEISGRTYMCPIAGCPFQFKRQADLAKHLAHIHHM